MATKVFPRASQIKLGDWGSCRDRHSLKFNKSWDMLIIENFFQLQPQLKKWFMSNDSQAVVWLNTFSMTFRLFCCYDGIAGPTIFQFCVRFESILHVNSAKFIDFLESIYHVFIYYGKVKSFKLSLPWKCTILSSW